MLVCEPVSVVITVYHLTLDFFFFFFFLRLFKYFQTVILACIEPYLYTFTCIGFHDLNPFYGLDVVFQLTKYFFLCSTLCVNC